MKGNALYAPKRRLSLRQILDELRLGNHHDSRYCSQAEEHKSVLLDDLLFLGKTPTFPTDLGRNGTVVFQILLFISKGVRPVFHIDRLRAETDPSNRRASAFYAREGPGWLFSLSSTHRPL